MVNSDRPALLLHVYLLRRANKLRQRNALWCCKEIPCGFAGQIILVVLGDEPKICELRTGRTWQNRTPNILHFNFEPRTLACNLPKKPELRPKFSQKWAEPTRPKFGKPNCSTVSSSNNLELRTFKQGSTPQLNHKHTKH